MAQPLSEISQRNRSTSEPACGSQPLAGGSRPLVATRTIPKLGWHFWFILVDLLSGFCLGGVAGDQDCPGGQCPIGQHRRQAPAAVAETPVADYHRAIVRVGREVLSEPGASYSGAGTFVARGVGRGLVLTASHVVDHGGGRIWVDFGRGRQAASLLGRDANLDLAALVVDNPPADVRAIPVADEDEWPHAGENVEVVGFGGGHFRHFSARVRGYTAKDFGACSRKALDLAWADDQGAVPGTEPEGLVAAQATGHPSETGIRVAQQARSQLIVAFQPISGDSGGAVLYKQKLTGILWGGPCDGPQEAAYETHATCCIYIRRFLEGIGVQLKPRRPPVEQSPSTTGPNSADPFAVGPTQIAPPQTAPQTVPPSPPQAAVSERLAAIERRLDDLAARLSPAGAGSAGAPGARGPQGLPGPPGKDADPAALAAIAGRVTALEKNLKGKLHFSLQVDSQTGKILSTSSGSQ